MEKGKVKFFDSGKGFGFITGANGTEYYVHSTGLAMQVSDGDAVTFDLEQGKKGMVAANVRKA
jgi:cold shock protein